jgi:uncharacterized protein with ParB-like and HNH nuclease domain
MIRKADKLSVSQLFTIDNDVTYSIPMYQREYTWSKEHWETLFNDIYENESGYFLGSVMCVTSENSPVFQKYEIIDGQQRMTTISLFFAAILKILEGMKGDLNEDQEDEFRALKKRLVFKDKVRLIPQTQGSNRDDFNAVLNDVGVYTGQKQNYAGLRKIFKAYFYFKESINDVLSKRANEDKAKIVLEILQKVLNAVVVNIIVDDYSDAFIMFESLNNRGEPLSAIDLVKNSLLANLGKEKASSVDSYYKQWGQLINYLGGEYAVQERFFRQYYNAFLDDYKDINASFSIATRSNLIKIYENIVRSNAEKFLADILIAGRIYSHIIGKPDSEDNDFDFLRKSLSDLAHIQGAPSYILLLYIFIKRKEHKLEENHFLSIINCLVKFSLRRNITNIPATYELPLMFREIIRQIKGKTGDDAVSFIEDAIISKSPSDEVFKEALMGPMYQDNTDPTRFILCYIEEQSMTRETQKDMWEQNDKKKYLWTIEHIFPEGENISEAWVDMIANGDANKAKEILRSHAHKLGNLSISGFNSKLSNRPFSDKRDLKDEKGQNIGYRNGIKLNEDLINKDTWTKECIDERTVKIVNTTLDLFKYR